MDATAVLQELTDELAGLRDLFRRRLLNDKAQQQVVQELSRRLDAADRRASGAMVTPVLRQLVLVLDRTEKDAALASVRDELEAILAWSGVTALGPTVGLPFDPRLHHAVATVDVDQPARDGVILAELRSGYLIDETVLRPADVTVGRLPSPTSCPRSIAGAEEASRKTGEEQADGSRVEVS